MMSPSLKSEVLKKMGGRFPPLSNTAKNSASVRMSFFSHDIVDKTILRAYSCDSSFFAPYQHL